MSEQATHVLKLSNQEGQILRKQLQQEGWEFRTLNYAHWQARQTGVVASLYESGKLVVQGAGAEGFLVRFFGSRPEVSAGTTNSGQSASEKKNIGLFPEGAAVGSDEAGKGDTFGGLAVAAVFVPPSEIAKIKETGLQDSKLIADEKILALAPWLREHFDHEERVLSAQEYNEAHAQHGANVNRLLAYLHGEVQEALLQRNDCHLAIVDRFSPQMPLTALLEKRVPGCHVHEVPRAESHLAVAAASVLAREAFLRSMEDLSEQAAVSLPLGSGSPVPPALRQLLEIHGQDGLKPFAKTHFKNVRKHMKS